MESLLSQNLVVYEEWRTGEMSRVWWLTPVTEILRWLLVQEHCGELEASPAFIVSSRPVWAGNEILTQTNKTKGEGNPKELELSRQGVSWRDTVGPCDCLFIKLGDLPTGVGADGR